MRKGVIQSYNREKHVGIIASEPNRFWFHRDRIIRGPMDPELDNLVAFEISSQPVLPGKLPIATQIIILENTGGAEALAGQTEQTRREVKS